LSLFSLFLRLYRSSRPGRRAILRAEAGDLPHARAAARQEVISWRDERARKREPAAAAFASPL